VQQINKDFTNENYASGKGSRWKVPGRPGADGGLRYLGEDISKYKSRYEIKTKDKPAAWNALKNLCKTLHETSPEDLPAALEGKLDIDGVLKFLAVDLAVVNSDGYWTRASDYCLFMDSSGKFHVIPYDMNEAFMTSGRGRRGRGPGGKGFNGRDPGRSRGQMSGNRGKGRNDRGNFGRPDRGGPDRGGRRGRGPGFGGPGFGGPGFGGPGFGGPRGGGPGGHGSHDLDPLVAIGDAKKPLHSKLLSVPIYKEKYLGYLKDIAENQMAEKNLKPFIAKYRKLVEKAIAQETRSMVSSKQFLDSTSPKSNSNGTLLYFLKKRREFLLNHKEIKNAKSISLQPKSTSISRPVKSTEAAVPKAPSNLLLSEIMAANSRSVPGPNGNFEDWIELHNRSNRVIDLSHYYLSDKAEQKDKWKFPDGTQIGPGKFLVVWADDSGQEGLHANFKLKKRGEAVFLTRIKPSSAKEPNLTLIDSVEFGKQTDGVSWARMGGKWQSAKPTAGSKNQN